MAVTVAQAVAGLVVVEVVVEEEYLEVLEVVHQVEETEPLGDFVQAVPMLEQVQIRVIPVAQLHRVQEVVGLATRVLDVL